MRRTYLGLVFALGLAATPLVAQEGDDAAIRSVIENQIAAFQKEDAGTAFTFASPMIQGMFGTPDNFGQMVRNGYPMIWDPAAVEYLGVRTENGRTIQRMKFRDAGGRSYLFDYDMVMLPEGWKINGVYPVPDDSVGA